MYLKLLGFTCVCCTIVCRWSKQHEALEKLNMQAVMNAAQQTDEFVKEYLVSYEKVQCCLGSGVCCEKHTQ